MVLRTSIRLAVTSLLFVAVERAALGAGELEGQIRGQVVEAATNVPVPGATVSVASPSLGDPRVATTNEEGEFLVTNLPAGSYRVTVSYAGLKPITRAIFVEPGVTSPLDIKWSAELAEAETTTVVEERPLTNPGSTQTGTVLSIAQQNHLPGGRRYSDVVRQIPGVTTNPGSTDHYIKGGRQTHNRYLIDGLDITDPARRVATQEHPFESIESVQVITGGLDAEYNVFGGIVNVITREGSDEWHGGASVYTTNEAINNRRPFGAQENEREKVFNDDPVAPSYSYRATAWVGGPIINHRLWFNATFEYRYSKSTRLIGPQLYVPHVPETSVGYLPRLKVTWAPSTKQRITVSFAGDPQVRNNSNGSNSRLSTYEDYIGTGGWNAVLNWSIFPSPAFDFRLDAGFKSAYTHAGPQGWFGEVDTRGCERFSLTNCSYVKDRSSHNNTADGTLWYNSTTAIDLDNRRSVQIDPKITVRGRWLGEHSTKIGLQLNYLLDIRNQHQAGEYAYSDNVAGGLPLEAGLCDPDFPQLPNCQTRQRIADRPTHTPGIVAAAFIQDYWRVTKWLTLSPGVRVDHGRTYTSDGKLFLSQYALAPRIGMIFDLSGDQKTIFSTGYGRSSQMADVGYPANYDLNFLGVTVRERWNGTEWVFDQKTGGEGGVLLNRKMKVPHADIFTSSLRREFFRNVVATIEHTWKRTGDTFDNGPEINRIWDPTGFRVINYVDGVNHTIRYYTNPEDNSRTYHGITVSAEGRPTPNWYFLGFYTLSWLYGAYESQNSEDAFLHIPQQSRFRKGFLPGDHRHQMHLAASYSFQGLTVGAVLEYVSGDPRRKNFNNATNSQTNGTNLRSPRGTEPGTCSGNVAGQGNFQPATTVCGNDYGLVSEYRNPARVQVDLHLEYDFYPLLRQHVALIGDIFNLFNDRSSTALAQNDTPSGGFGSAGSRNGATNIRLGARYDF